MDKNSVLSKITKFCAYQERCLMEVKEKLNTFDISKQEEKDLIQFLEQDNYFNDLRYAQSVVRGKFGLKNWGRIKIVYALKQKNISIKNIDIALEEITEEEYEKTLTALIKKKAKQLLEENTLENNTEKNIFNQKIWTYAQNKGYENEYIKKIIKNLDITNLSI
ncbi:MAG: RecX family transcriptional regulator [Bacteroidetes bacterium]|nr:MAG: RecX family transcriptional regulator [Bacteroidota bacterium]TAG93394.1 MAG: RecX family transcriptional regulator [Bacteroidota bacterium]